MIRFRSLSMLFLVLVVMFVQFPQTVNATEADKWNVPAKMSGVTNGAIFSGNILTLGSKDNKKGIAYSSLVNYKGVYNDDIITFTLKPERLGSSNAKEKVTYMGIVFRAKTEQGVIWDNRTQGYFVGIKAGWFEIRRFIDPGEGPPTGEELEEGKVFIPNNGAIKDGKTSKIEVGAHTNGDGTVNVFLKVDGKEIFNLKDSKQHLVNGALTENKYVQIMSFEGFKGIVNFGTEEIPVMTEPEETKKDVQSSEKTQATVKADSNSEKDTTSTVSETTKTVSDQTIKQDNGAKLEETVAEVSTKAETSVSEVPTVEALETDAETATKTTTEQNTETAAEIKTQPETETTSEEGSSEQMTSKTEAFNKDEPNHKKDNIDSGTTIFLIIAGILIFGVTGTVLYVKRKKV